MYNTIILRWIYTPVPNFIAMKLKLSCTLNALLCECPLIIITEVIDLLYEYIMNQLLWVTVTK